MSIIRAKQAGLGGKGVLSAAGLTREYIDLGDGLDFLVAAHDTTDDIIINAGNEKGWVDIEVDFDNARRLIEALQKAMDRKRPPRAPDPPYNIPS